MDMPQAFLERMGAYLGDEAGAFAAALAQEPTRGLHVNRKKPVSVDLFGSSLAKIPYAEDGYYLEGTDKIGRHPLHHAGAFYVQEPSAMAPVCGMAWEEGLRALDLCASPGGKSTQIANRIGDGGLLVSNEIMPARCATLAGNLERMGLTQCVVTNTDAATLAALYPAFFDRVVVDAPCSGEGMFRKDPLARQAWNEGNVRACAERQRDILHHAALLLRPGGELLYSTCTFSREENEGTLMEFLSCHREFSLAPLSDGVVAHTAPALQVEGDGEISAAICRYARRFYPHVARGEGQFMARLVKDATAPVQKPPKRQADDTRPLSQEEMRAWDGFVRDCFVEEAPLPTPRMFKDSISLLPYDLPLSARVTYARGVQAGRVEKGRLVPMHWLFSAYGSFFRRRLELTLDDPRVEAYLRGETVTCDLPNGWGAVLVEDCPLGGIKITDGVAKNHYPKGLRLKGE